MTAKLKWIFKTKKKRTTLENSCGHLSECYITGRPAQPEYFPNILPALLHLLCNTYLFEWTTKSIMKLKINLILAKLMVATGDPTPVCTKTEVIDLIDANNICETLGDYPLEMASGFGGLLNGNLPVLCGGFNPDIEGYVLRECYALTEVIYNFGYFCLFLLKTVSFNLAKKIYFQIF